MMFEVIFTDIYFEEGQCYKQQKLIVAKSIDELLAFFSEFDRLFITNVKARRINQMTHYEQICREAEAVIPLERLKKISSDEAYRLIYGDHRS